MHGNHQALGAARGGPAHFAPVPSRISAWDGKTGVALGTGYASGGFRDGVRVGTGDRNNDGHDEIFVCTGPSTIASHFEIFEYSSVEPHIRGTSSIIGLGYITGKNAYWGCRAAGGDLDADGKDELIAIFEGPANTLLIRNPVTGYQVRGNALGAGYAGSTSLAVADLNFDKKAEVFLGRLTGQDYLPPVFAYNGAKLLASGTLPTPTIFYPIENSSSRTGIYLAARDLNGDGVPELLAKLSTTSGFSAYVAKIGPSFNSIWRQALEWPGTLPAGGPIG